MKYYLRHITIRTTINKYGKLGYVPAIEYVKTNNIEPFNYKKQIKFVESKEAKKYLYWLKKDCVYCESEELTVSQAYCQRNISKYRR